METLETTTTTTYVPQSIAEIVGMFTQVRIAKPSDNTAILEFLKSQPMQTADFAIGFYRGTDFFAFYRLSSKHFETFLFLNEDGSIGGLGTLLFQDVVMNGQQERIGYFCDLRVDAKASAITHIQWRAFYAVLVGGLRGLPDPKERCSFLYTSVFDTNARAIRALTKKLKGIRYIPFHAYQTQSLLVHPGAHLRPARTTRTYASPLPPANFALGWQPGSENGAILNAVGSDGRVLATCRPWLSHGIRQPVISGMSRTLKLLGASLPVMGRPAIREDQALSQIFLTQIRFAPGLSLAEKDEARATLVRGVYLQAVRENIHLVSWTEPRDLAPEGATVVVGSRGLAESMKSMSLDVRFATAAKLYEVVSTEQTSRAGELSGTEIYFEGAIL